MGKRLPKEWRMARLGETVTCLDEQRRPINEVERLNRQGNIPYYGANGQVGWIDDFLFDKKLLLVAEDGGYWKAFEKSAYIIEGKSWVNNHAHVLSENGTVLLEFLNYYFFIADLSLYITGTTRGKLNKQSLLKINIPLPPLPTQKRIVEILEEADSLRKLRRQADEKMQDLIPSLFVEMFGDPATNPKGWRMARLGEVCDIIGGGTPSKANSKFYNGDIPWATVRDMNYDFITETEHKITIEAVKNSNTNIIPKNNVIIATRVGLGKVCILKNDTAINQDLKGVIPKNPAALSVGYLFRCLKSVAHIIEKEGTGATVQGVKLPFIKSISIPLPPLSLQQEFAARVGEIEAEKARQTESRKKLDELFSSLMQRAFTGELMA